MSDIFEKIINDADNKKVTLALIKAHPDFADFAFRVCRNTGDLVHNDVEFQRGVASTILYIMTRSKIQRVTKQEMIKCH